MENRTYSDFQEFIGTEKFFDYEETAPSSFTNQLVNNEKNFEPIQEMETKDYLVAFSSKTHSYCVGLIDMVDSTKISATIGPARISRYYQIFLNSMSRILSRFGGFVIKNAGDSLIYYFPESAKKNNRFGLMSCLECSLAMIESHDQICARLKKEGLPSIDYRVSADYGQVVMMNANNGSALDMIGPPVNMCAKINHCIPKNHIAIGGDLYELVRKFENYSFKETEGCSLGFKHAYPIYCLRRQE